MKQLFTYILIFISTLFLFNCKKSGYGYVDGHVYETETKAPIKNVKIMLVESHYSNQGQPLSEVKTDENGYFKIKYFHSPIGSNSYYVNVRTDSYYRLKSGDKYVTKRKENLEFYFTPIAYVKFHIKNNTSNNYSLTVFNDDFDSSTTLSGYAFEDKISPNLLEVSGNSSTKIRWDYLGNSYSDNVTIHQKLDTLIYLITLN